MPGPDTEAFYEEWGDERYPPYAVTEAERRRWDICHGLATTVSKANELDHVADPQVVWYLERELYRSGMPVDEAELDAMQEAAAEQERTDVAEALARLEALPDPRTAEEAWEAVGAACDVLDVALGDPGDWDLGEFEEDDPEPERRLMEGLLPEFAEKLHPRDRLGRWRRKLEALRRFVEQNRRLLKAKARGRAADVAAARALKASVRHAHRPGGALHGKPNEAVGLTEREAHALAQQQGISLEAARARIVRAARDALAAEERARHGKGRVRQAAHTAHVMAVGTLLNQLADLYSGQHKAETVMGTAKHDVSELWSQEQNLESAAFASKALARWAAEHHEEIRHLSALAHHVLRLKGLAAAALEPDEDGADLALVEALLDQGEP